jgi:uncharacterized peroxidase-related enzyme
MPYVKPLTRKDLSQFEQLFQQRDAIAGYVSNSMLTMGHRPEILGAFIGFLDAIYQHGVVDHQLKVMVALMRSVAAGCRYCQAHTATRAGKLSIEEAKIEAIWDFEASPLFSDAERAALRLARDAAFVPNATTEEHFLELRKHFSDAEVVEIVSVIGLFAFLNTFNDTLATSLEPSPLAFAESRLAGQGWQAGKHGASSAPS